MKKIDFTNKTVFLTGGSGGIGGEIKNYFKQLNASVIAPDVDELDLLSEDSIKKYLENNKNLKDIFYLANNFCLNHTDFGYFITLPAIFSEVPLVFSHLPLQYHIPPESYPDYLPFCQY